MKNAKLYNGEWGLNRNQPDNVALLYDLDKL